MFSLDVRRRHHVNANAKAAADTDAADKDDVGLAAAGRHALEAVNISGQLNWRQAVTRIASKPAETTRYSDASFVNAFPRSPFASGNMKTSGPDIAAMAGRISRHQSRHHMR
jgi:hypothetical protein